MGLGPIIKDQQEKNWFIPPSSNTHLTRVEHTGSREDKQCHQLSKQVGQGLCLCEVTEGQVQPIAVMWEDGLSVARSSDFSKEARNLGFHILQNNFLNK